jgi:hypothetical protein
LIKVVLLSSHHPFFYRYGNNPNLCSNGNSCQTTKGKSKLGIYIAVPVVLVVAIVSVVVLLFGLLRREKRGGTSIALSSNLPILNTELTPPTLCHCHSGTTNNSVKPQNETPMSHVPTRDAYHPQWQSSLHLENRRFTYKELEVITNNFQRVLGRGGFGKVYDGFLEDGTQVAVKLRSDSSNQGVKEFLAEVKLFLV